MQGDLKLTAEQEAGKQRAIDQCKGSGGMQNIDGNGWDAYAYPLDEDRIAWGVNGGPDRFCIARGTVPK